MTTATMRTIVEFARDILELRLSPLQQQALEAMTTHQLVVLACGRRSGKSLLAAIAAAYDASLSDLSVHLRPGEVRYVVLVAASLSQARALFRVLAGFFKAPMLNALVVGEPTQDEIRLTTNVIVKVVPCNSRTTRGLAISAVIMEELAHFVDSDCHQSGEQVYAALAPSTAQFGANGRVICLSTPRGQRGAFWRLYQQAQSRADCYALRAPTAAMNPLISADFLDREREANPELYGQEFEAEFTVGGGSFIDGALLTRATGDLEHEGAHVRTLALDPAFSQDSYGLAVACSPEGSQTAYLEHVSVLKHPGFEESLAHVAELAEEWEPSRVVTDQMSSRAIIEGLGRHGVSASQVPWTGRSSTGHSKAHRYGQVKTLLRQERLRLVDDAQLRSELADITVSPAAVDPGYAIETHGPDDRADAAVMAITEAAGTGRGRANFRWIA